jgi:hypothetical protein
MGFCASVVGVFKLPSKCLQGQWSTLKLEQLDANYRREFNSRAVRCLRGRTIMLAGCCGCFYRMKFGDVLIETDCVVTALRPYAMRVTKWWLVPSVQQTVKHASWLVRQRRLHPTLVCSGGARLRGQQTVVRAPAGKGCVLANEMGQIILYPRASVQILVP